MGRMLSVGESDTLGGAVTSPIDPAVALSGRELECLNLMARGLTDRQISECLGIVRSTVNFHSRNITAKLKTSNRCSAVYEACRRGII